MWKVEYYQRFNGREPAKDWKNEQDNSIKPSIDARVNMLRQEGLALIENKILEPIRESPGGKLIVNFYELRHVGKKWRLSVYYDSRKDSFILISGWRKSQRIQQQDVDVAIRLLKEYLSE
jgi:hypothetical protein